MYKPQVVTASVWPVKYNTILYLLKLCHFKFTSQVKGWKPLLNRSNEVLKTFFMRRENASHGFMCASSTFVETVPVLASMSSLTHLNYILLRFLSTWKTCPSSLTASKRNDQYDHLWAVWIRTTQETFQIKYFILLYFFDLFKIY